MASLILATPCGQISGEEENGIGKFLGVRFATASRFEKPVVVTEWDGVYQADKMMPACYQYRAFYDESLATPFYYKEFREGLSFTYSEDCLSLNIFIPLKAKKAPVILHFFGGSFTRGSNDEKPLDGTALAKKGVIFIAGSYRLNAFGKVSYQGSPYNLALYDMWAALTWVKNNIAAFGGNPDNITLMGQSAGAISIQALLFNKDFRKDVKGAVLLSGGGFKKGLFAPKSPFLINRFSKKLKGDLKTMEPKELFEQFNAREKKDKLSSFALLPVYDEVLIRKKDHKKMPEDMPPLIIGSVKNDIVSFLLPKQIKKYQRKSKTPVYIYRFMHELPGGSKTNFHSADLWYFFSSLSRSWRKETEEDKKLENLMTDYLVNFASYQNPNKDGLEKWDLKEERLFL